MKLNCEHPEVEPQTSPTSKLQLLGCFEQGGSEVLLLYLQKGIMSFEIMVNHFFNR